MFQLIADSGSTKTDWTLINKESNEVLYTFKSPGYNPLFWKKEALSKVLEEDFERLKATFSSDNIKQVFFYGAGCGTSERKAIIHYALANHFTDAQIFIESDLLGAARGLFIKKSGIAAILGTGANSCLFEKGQIIDRPVSLGYLLSDFGSGATLGLSFLQKLLTTQLSIETISAFIDTFNLSTEDILNALYKEKKPNTFCASFAPFIIQHYEHDEQLKSIVLEQFHKFIQYYIIPFKNNKNSEIRITGSIAHHFSPLLKQSFTDLNLDTPKIIQSPSD